MVTKLTHTQIDKIRNYFVIEIRDIDKLKISDEEKISIVGALLEGYKIGFETCAGTKFEIKDIDIIFGIESELAMFGEQVGLVEPGIDAKESVEWIASSTWGEITKMMKKT